MAQLKHDYSDLILITGSSGFIGQNLCSYLNDLKLPFRRVCRNPIEGISSVSVGDIGPHTDWRRALEGVTHVVHLAARVHVMNDHLKDPLSLYNEVNALATLQLAKMAASSGVKRFVFMSTAKVHGEFTESILHPSDPSIFHERLVPAPADAYGLSKLQAEMGLRQIEAESGMEVVILRPPLVYGPRVRANFLKLIRLVASGFPLPFGQVKNIRSMIFLGNLISSIHSVLFHPRAAGKTFLVSDGRGISTLELCREIAEHLNVPLRVFSTPNRMLLNLSKILGKREVAERLLGSFHLDSAEIHKSLDWNPPFTFQEGVRATVEWYVRETKRANKQNLSYSSVQP